MKIVSILGARPQFIKSAMITRQLKINVLFKNIDHNIIHTGQHYDYNMSENFFNQLDIPEAEYNIGVGSSTHATQTGEMLISLENVLTKEKPDWILVYGDTNSTIAGALAASKLNIKIAHIEAGLRSYNRNMPEEINRIITDRISDILFVPTKNAMNILHQEGMKEKSIFVGDIMYDAILYYQKLAEQKVNINDITLEEPYYLATIHRQENTDDLKQLQNIFSALSELDAHVILPLHPRTLKYLKNIKFNKNVRIIEPVGYLEMVLLLKNCIKVLTDSGGLQKEAYFLGKPCVTLRKETEWIETLENNWNFVVGTHVQKILEKINWNSFGKRKNHFGDGNTSEKILTYLNTY